MKIYKELGFAADESEYDKMFKDIYNVFPADWICPKGNSLLDDYILAEYIGSALPHAQVSIYCGQDSWKKGCIKVGNIVPLDKNKLTVDEYNALLDKFSEDIAVPYVTKNPNIKLVGPTSDMFDPLQYISSEALKKLELFSNVANKSTGSSHPEDEKRWFDFICQTIEDGRLFDYDVLYKFLMDEDYWCKKCKNTVWDEEKAEKLASEYDNYVRLLQYYRENW